MFRHRLACSCSSSSSRKLIIAVLVLSWSHLAHCQLKDGTYSAAMMDLACSSDLLFYPSSTDDVAAHVQTQLKAAAASGTGLKIRATHRAFHSTAPFTCPGSSLRTHPNRDNKPVLDPSTASAPSSAVSPVSNTTSVTFLLEGMNKVLAVDHAAKQMRVQAGMLITQLLKEATAAGMSVPLGSVPAFGDLTLGGVLVTGAHGTGHKATSSLGDIVVELTWVDGLGNIRKDSRDSEAGRALVGGLGVAGLVTELLLQLEPPSLTAVDTKFKQHDGKLYQDVIELLKLSPHVLIVWRPDLHSYTAHITRKVNGSAPVTVKINNVDLPNFVAQGLGKAIQLWQEDVHDLLPVTLPPILTAINEASIGHTLSVNMFNIPAKKGVGKTNDMQAISCGKKCLWNTGSKIAMDDVHFSIELDQLQAWIDDVHAVLAADLWHKGFKPFRVMSPGYFWLRFGHGSSDYISPVSSMQAPVHVQMSFMKSLAKGVGTSKYGWVLDVLEQLTMCKYKGKPHWGKNHERAFKHPTCHIRDHLPLWHQMETFASSSDPQKIYQPQLFEHMAARVPHGSSPGCSSRGECYCTEDSHCAKGQQCLPSMAFPEYKACRLPGLL